MSVEHARITLEETRAAAGHSAFAADVRAGLAAERKALPCQYIYDARGSALFERICALEAYYPPRAEREILQRHGAEIVRELDAPCEVVELGSGSGEKTDLLLGALSERQGPVSYVPIDVSRSALEQSAQRMVGDHEELTIRALVGDYDSALASLTRDAHPRLFVWLGSSIGNLDRGQAARFLSKLPLRDRDQAFIGFDLRKERSVLERAYDDPEGVTRLFIMNVLERVNRQLGADFDLGAFEYVARYDEDAGYVDMSLRSSGPQRVRIEHLDLDVELSAGELIHVENSYKYSPEEIESLAGVAGLRVERSWFDGGRRFCSVLLSRAD